MLVVEEEGKKGAGPQSFVLLPAGAAGPQQMIHWWRLERGCREGGSSLSCCVITSLAWILLNATCSSSAERARVRTAQKSKMVQSLSLLQIPVCS